MPSVSDSLATMKMTHLQPIELACDHLNELTCDTGHANGSGSCATGTCRCQQDVRESQQSYTLAHHDARSATKAQASESNGHKRGGPYAIHDQSIMAQDVSALVVETVGKLNLLNHLRLSNAHVETRLVNHGFKEKKLSPPQT